MKSARPVVLDDCVQVPVPLADTLLRIAAGSRLFLPKWSDQIMVEMVEVQKSHTPRERNQATFPEGWIEGYEDLIPTMTNRSKDCPVLAAAADAGVKVIVWAPEVG